MADIGGKVRFQAHPGHAGGKRGHLGDRVVDRAFGREQLFGDFAGSVQALVEHHDLPRALGADVGDCEAREFRLRPGG